MSLPVTYCSHRYSDPDGDCDCIYSDYWGDYVAFPPGYDPSVEETEEKSLERVEGPPA